MHTRISTALGTVVAAVALIALALGLSTLLHGNAQPTARTAYSPTATSQALLPSATVEEKPPTATPEALIFAGAILYDSPTRLDQPIPYTLMEYDPTEPGEPFGEIAFELPWRVIAPVSVDWVVFAHLTNSVGEVIAQSDVAVDWPDGPCSAEFDLECFVVSRHHWVAPSNLPPGQYTLSVGLYDPGSQDRAPVTSPAGMTYPVTLGPVPALAGGTALPTAAPSPSASTAVPTAAPLPTSPAPADGWAIYLVIQEIPPQDLPLVDPSQLEIADEPLLTLDDVLTYTWESHEMTLTDAAYERLAQLQVPIAPGLPFVVYADGQAIYAGAFWVSYSSASFNGIVIDVLPATSKRSLRVQLGYPESPELFVGEDLRSDPRIFQAFDEAGKLAPQPRPIPAP